MTTNQLCSDADKAPCFPEENAAPESSTKPRMWIRRVLLACSVMLLLPICVAYWFRFDCCTAVTVYPPWCWLVVGWLLALPAMMRGIPRTATICCALWLVFGLIFYDSPISLLRTFRTASDSKRTLRVVTLNCKSKATAAKEVVYFEPDIVLMQESPGPQQVKELAEELFGEDGSVLWSPDTSIVARGELSPKNAKNSRSSPFVSASLQLPGSEKTLQVICLRLRPCPVRFDLWSPRCWSVYNENRRERREQMKRVAKEVEAFAGRATICGGDFNAPPGDAVFRLLKPRMADTFPAAGRGWGRTFINEFPVIRIDQVWISKHFEVVNVFAKSTEHSDHRMVVCDLILSPKE